MIQWETEHNSGLPLVCSFPFFFEAVSCGTLYSISPCFKFSLVFLFRIAVMNVTRADTKE